MSGRGIKAWLLVIILVLPVGLYLFLQRYGENQYQVPVFYQSGIEDPQPQCDHEPGEHSVNGFSLTSVTQRNLGPESLSGRLTVFSFFQEDCDPQNLILDEIARICNDYRDNPRVAAVSLMLDSLYQISHWERITATYGLRPDNWELLPFQEQTHQLISCGLNLPVAPCLAAGQLVLVDGRLKIRGYYNATDPKDVDRLIVEMEILLRNDEDYGT